MEKEEMLEEEDLQKSGKTVTTSEKELKKLITDAVAKGVKKGGRGHFRLSAILSIILIVCLAWFGYQQYISIHKNLGSVGQVEDHDLTLENKGIFGYTAADFGKVVIEKSSREAKLIVDKKEVSVPTVITKAGLLNLGVFSKSQNETIYGVGEYTIDLSQLQQDDIQLNEDNFTVTVTVPYPELNTDTVAMDPSKTVIGDTDKGWLSFGDIKLTAEEQQAFEVEARQKLQERLSQQDCYEEAVKFAKLSIHDLLEPVIESVSPAYKVEIVVSQPKAQ